jgi:hypothetical protein
MRKRRRAPRSGFVHFVRIFASSVKSVPLVGLPAPAFWLGLCLSMGRGLTKSVARPTGLALSAVCAKEVVPTTRSGCADG